MPDVVPEFDEFVAVKGHALLRVAYLLAGDEHLAEDHLQEVLERMYIRWRHIRESPESYARKALVRRSIDQDQIRRTYSIVDPLRGAPARQCRKIKTDRLCPEPRPPQLDPGREAALRIDIESCDPRAAARPGDRKLGGERRLA